MWRSEQENSVSPKIVYSAMHGVGAKLVAEILQAFGFQPYIAVQEQIEPDPDFPTVYYPNPEEGEGSIKLSL